MSPFPRRAAKAQARPCDFEPPPPPRGWTRQGRPKGCLPRWCALPSPRRPDLTPAAVWRGIRQSMRRPTVYRDTTLSKYVYRHYVHERFRNHIVEGIRTSAAAEPKGRGEHKTVCAQWWEAVYAHTVNNNKDHTHLHEKNYKSTRRPPVYRDQGRQIESTQAESQWIVGQSLLSALTIPGGN